MESLHRGEFAELASRAAASPRVLRTLVGRLWESDALLCGGAAETLGELAALWPEMAVELVRRFLWALNEESGTNGVALLPALAAMARSAPAVVGPFAGALVAHLDDEGMRAALVDVLSVLEQADRKWLEPHAKELARQGLDLAGGFPRRGEESDQ